LLCMEGLFPAAFKLLAELVVAVAQLLKASVK
jgi:hypothetical protein